MSNPPMTLMLARYLDDAAEHVRSCDFCVQQRPCAVATVLLQAMTRYWAERRAAWQDTGTGRSVPGLPAETIADGDAGYGYRPPGSRPTIPAPVPRAPALPEGRGPGGQPAAGHR